MYIEHQLVQLVNSVSGDSRSSLFLRHRLSVAVTRGNCLAVLGSIPGAGFYLLGGEGGKLPPQNVNLPPQTFS